MRRPARTIVATAIAASFAAASARGADTTAWRVDRGDVRVVCPLTVGGSFEAKTTALSGSLAPVSARPAAFGGALSVDLRTLDTGIGLRNEHLRGEYLEVGKGEGFDTAVLSELDLGETPAESLHGRTRFTGTLRLHGVTRAVSGQADVRRDASAVHVDATFPVILADYGIAKPRYLGIGVKDAVQVKVSLVATPQTAAASR